MILFEPYYGCHVKALLDVVVDTGIGMYLEREEHLDENLFGSLCLQQTILHIACAEMAKADFFVTCDDLLVRKGMANKERLKVKIIGLMEFLAKEVFKT